MECKGRKEVVKMSEEVTILDILRIITLWMGPVIMILGSFILVLKSGAYSSLEDKLGKEVGGIRKRIMPLIETNIYSLHKWMLARKNIVSVVFVACSLLMLFSLKK
jgi:hypothetical protein